MRLRNVALATTAAVTTARDSGEFNLNQIPEEFQHLIAEEVFERPAELPPLGVLQALAEDSRSDYAFDQFYGQNCGALGGDRIVGGHFTKISKHPWQVYFQAGITPSYKMKCGASIISPTWAISAAHCTLWGVHAKYSAIVHGLTRLPSRQSKATVPRNNWADCKTILAHPSYNKFTKVNDIALVETLTPLHLDANTWPVCLPPNYFCLKDGTKVETSGWGTIKAGGPVSDILKAVSLPLMGTKRCDRTHSYVKVDTTMVCAGGIEGQDACQGDSGGPLIHRDPNNVATLIGATSWGIGCARKGLPGAYARVTKYLDWIKQVTKVDNDGEEAPMEKCHDNYNQVRPLTGKPPKPAPPATTQAPTTTKATTTRATTTTPKPTTTTPKPTTTRKPVTQAPTTAAPVTKPAASNIIYATPSTKPCVSVRINRRKFCCKHLGPHWKKKYRKCRHVPRAPCTRVRTRKGKVTRWECCERLPFKVAAKLSGCNKENRATVEVEEEQCSEKVRVGRRGVWCCDQLKPMSLKRFQEKKGKCLSLPAPAAQICPEYTTWGGKKRCCNAMPKRFYKKLHRHRKCLEYGPGKE